MYLSPERKTKRKWTKAQLEARRRQLLGRVQDNVDEWVQEIKVEKFRKERDQVD